MASAKSVQMLRGNSELGQDLSLLGGNQLELSGRDGSTEKYLLDMTYFLGVFYSRCDQKKKNLLTPESACASKPP